MLPFVLVQQGPPMSAPSLDLVENYSPANEGLFLHCARLIPKQVFHRIERFPNRLFKSFKKEHIA